MSETEAGNNEGENRPEVEEETSSEDKVAEDSIGSDQESPFDDTNVIDSSDSDASHDRFASDRAAFNRPGGNIGRIGKGALEVSVDHNIEKAIKILKRKIIKEGLFKELKSRRYYEKPSDRRKRKEKESLKKLRKDEARMKKNPYMM